MYPSIYRKIRWAFGIPTLIMFAIFWATIYVAENQLEIISLEHWLDTEYARYQRDFHQLGDSAPEPNPHEFITYQPLDTLPTWLAAYQKPGFYGHRTDGETTHFLVRPHPSGQGLLYIVFQEHADDYLDEYEAQLHLMTFILGAIVTGCVLVYSLYFIRSISAPLASIEKKIPYMAPDQPDFEVESQFRETREIEKTLLKSKTDISRYFQREQDFGRFASHELRTPITVVKGSAELLERLSIDHPLANKAIGRIHAASEEMSLLTDAFLLLGKAEIEDQFWSEIDIAAELQRVIQTLLPLYPSRACLIDTATSRQPQLAPRSFVVIVLNNLVKNALAYSDDDLKVTLTLEHLIIENNYSETDTAGYGCGLVIVERICERLDWSFEVTKLDSRYQACVTFPVMAQST
ncbi:sensor histidine kinase [Thaumasiovibrio subtropicus]|uniref:sensor histidine kinase n=1 Tax=Thaumasiovibrio subtropicus TaxID=1891207 RepID=UPI000B34AC2F|nr:HAMP domain-containing sensor histidine kinase [Thaumasiovibrio subtropicus]